MSAISPSRERDLSTLINGNQPRAGWPFACIPVSYLEALCDGPAAAGVQYDALVSRLLAAGWHYSNSYDAWVRE